MIFLFTYAVQESLVASKERNSFAEFSVKDVKDGLDSLFA